MRLMKTQVTPKQLSNKHEKEIAEALDGQVRIASGALWTMKGDVITPKFLVECKATQKKYYILKRVILEKIEKEGLKGGRIPLLAVRVDNTDYILFRTFDFFEFTHGALQVKETFKLDEEKLKSCFNARLELDVGGTYWSLTTLEDFLERFAGVEL